MTATGDHVLENVDVEQMAAELDELQGRLDALARHGTNPHEVRRLQRALNAARRELDALGRGSAATG